jgi:hypothetical protein
MDINNVTLIAQCKELLQAYKASALGNCAMPEDSHPVFTSEEERLVYFTLPMSLNYQRNSYQLWKSCLQTANDNELRRVISLQYSANTSIEILRSQLLQYRIALQPNKHIATWQTIAKTIHTHFGTISNMLKSVNYDFIELQKLIQVTHKKGFPYLSGPKIFHYWCFILMLYCTVPLKNAEYIDIAPDTHITQCSIKLGVITSEESTTLTKEKISTRWRTLLHDSGITPIQMHPPLWFWSRNDFSYQLLTK